MAKEDSRLDSSVKPANPISDSIIDNAKMSESQRAPLELAESSRDTHELSGFAAGIFDGAPDFSTILPSSLRTTGKRATSSWKSSPPSFPPTSPSASRSRCPPSAPMCKGSNSSPPPRPCRHRHRAPNSLPLRRPRPCPRRQGVLGNRPLHRQTRHHPLRNPLFRKRQSPRCGGQSPRAEPYGINPGDFQCIDTVAGRVLTSR